MEQRPSRNMNSGGASTDSCALRRRALRPHDAGGALRPHDVGGFLLQPLSCLMSPCAKSMNRASQTFSGLNEEDGRGRGGDTDSDH